MDWPILYKQVLHVKDPNNPVGVVVMWTERAIVADMLKDANYCAIGNLYSSAGISASRADTVFSVLPTASRRAVIPRGTKVLFVNGGTE